MDNKFKFRNVIRGCKMLDLYIGQDGITELSSVDVNTIHVMPWVKDAILVIDDACNVGNIVGSGKYTKMTLTEMMFTDEHKMTKADFQNEMRKFASGKFEWSEESTDDCFIWIHENDYVAIEYVDENHFAVECENGYTKAYDNIEGAEEDIEALIYEALSNEENY